MKICYQHVLKPIQSGNKILFFGNGGSAADAQHLATELTVRFIHDRDPIAAIALTTDTSHPDRSKETTLGMIIFFRDK